MGHSLPCVVCLISPTCHCHRADMLLSDRMSVRTDEVFIVISMYMCTLGPRRGGGWGVNQRSKPQRFLKLQTI